MGRSMKCGLAGEVIPDNALGIRGMEALAALRCRDEPEAVLQQLNQALMSGSKGQMLDLLRHMAQADGGLRAVADRAGLNPTQLYRTLSSQGNPSLSSLLAIMEALGLRLSVEPAGVDDTPRAEVGDTMPVAVWLESDAARN